MDRYRIILGTVLLLGLLALAAAISLGKVEEKTSYGLVPILTLVGKVVLDFSEWAFNQHRRDKDEKITAPPDDEQK